MPSFLIKIEKKMKKENTELKMLVCITDNRSTKLEFYPKMDVSEIHLRFLFRFYSRCREFSHERPISVPPRHIICG